MEELVEIERVIADNVKYFFSIKISLFISFLRVENLKFIMSLLKSKLKLENLKMKLFISIISTIKIFYFNLIHF